MQRSARRWLALALADDAWSLEDERIEVADDQRPVGIVETTTPVSVEFARVSIPQGDVRKRTTVTVTLYPITSGTAQECGRRARELVDAIEEAWTFGLVVPGAVPGVDPDVFAWPPSALPLWDAGLLADDAAVVGGPIAFALADSVTVRDIPDPLDDRRWTVVLELRLTWWSGGRSRKGTAVDPTATRVVPPVFTPAP